MQQGKIVNTTRIVFIIAISSVLFLTNCNDDKNITAQPKFNFGYGDTLQKVNRYLIRKDAELIEAYINRMKWDMEVTGSGLWYKIEHNKMGESLKADEKAYIKYKIELLDGTICYDKTDKYIEVAAGRGSESKGINEAMLLLSKGDRAVFIMPPYLGFGFAGDFEKIPANSIIVYYVEIAK